MQTFDKINTCGPIYQMGPVMSLPKEAGALRTAVFRLNWKVGR